MRSAKGGLATAPKSVSFAAEATEGAQRNTEIGRDEGRSGILFRSNAPSLLEEAPAYSDARSDAGDAPVGFGAHSRYASSGPLPSGMPLHASVAPAADGASGGAGTVLSHRTRSSLASPHPTQGGARAVTATPRGHAVESALAHTPAGVTRSIYRQPPPRRRNWCQRVCQYLFAW